MNSIGLFLGISLTGPVLRDLEAADKSLVALFFGAGEDYLIEVSYKGERYIGKFAGSVCEMGHVELLKINICSLLKKLLPTTSFSESSLVLFPAVVPADAKTTTTL